MRVQLLVANRGSVSASSAKGATRRSYTVWQARDLQRAHSQAANCGYVYTQSIGSSGRPRYRSLTGKINAKRHFYSQSVCHGGV